MSFKDKMSKRNGSTNEIGDDYEYIKNASKNQKDGDLDNNQRKSIIPIPEEEEKKPASKGRMFYMTDETRKVQLPFLTKVYKQKSDSATLSYIIEQLYESEKENEDNR